MALRNYSHDPRKFDILRVGLGDYSSEIVGVGEMGHAPGWL